MKVLSLDRLCLKDSFSKKQKKTLPSRNIVKILTILLLINIYNF